MKIVCALIPLILVACTSQKDKIINRENQIKKELPADEAEVTRFATQNMGKMPDSVLSLKTFELRKKVDDRHHEYDSLERELKKY